jgi:glycosyltransferase involved in cell wall biosynthesis
MTLNVVVTGPGRVVFFAAYPHTFGGTERALELLAPGLAERGWTVEVVLPISGPVADHLAAAGVDVDVVQAPPSLLVYGRATRGRRGAVAAAALPAYWARVHRRVRGADVVHAFAQRGIVLAGPPARLAGVPLVWHVGGSDPGRFLNTAAIRMASAVIAVSRSAAEALPASTGVDVVPNAVDPRAFGVAKTFPSAGFDAACAARLTPEKGVDVLVRATALLRADAPNLRVLVLGAVQTGHEAYAAELTRLAEQLGVADAVCFAGFADRPYERWAGARVYVQPSRREGFGLAAVEAMASGVPVVATSVGGLVDVVEGGRAGVLVPPDDPRALAGGIKRLLDDPGEAQRLARAGRERAASHYTVGRMVDGVEAVYRRLAP